MLCCEADSTRGLGRFLLPDVNQPADCKPSLGRGGGRWLSPGSVGLDSEALLEQEVGWELCMGVASCQTRVPGRQSCELAVQARLPGCEVTSEERAVCSLHIWDMKFLSDVWFAFSRPFLRLPFHFVNGFCGCAAFWLDVAALYFLPFSSTCKDCLENASSTCHLSTIKWEHSTSNHICLLL